MDGYHNASGAPCTFDSPTGRRPAIYPSSNTTFAQITDGTSNTIVFSEMLTGPVTTPTDPNMDLRGIWSEDMVCSFSGLLSPNSSAGDQCLGNCIDDPSGGTPAARSSSPYWGHWANAARSRHPGGVNVCMVDGSAHFVTNSIDINLWQALISANGADVGHHRRMNWAPGGQGMKARQRTPNDLRLMFRISVECRRLGSPKRKCDNGSDIFQWIPHVLRIVLLRAPAGRLRPVRAPAV